MKKKKETKKPTSKKKSVKETKKVSKSIQESASTIKRESKGPEGSFICPQTGQKILKKDCIIDKQKTKTVYFYGTIDDPGYNKVYIEKNDIKK